MGKDITEDMLRRMEEEAIYEMLHYHEKSGKQKIKDTVKRAAGRYVAPKDLIFWPTAMIANCLTEWEMGGGVFLNDLLLERVSPVGEKAFSVGEKALSAVKDYFDRWIDAGMPLFYIDDVLAGVSLIDLYAATGEGKYKIGADKMAEYLFRMEKEAADEEGSIPYRPAQKNGYVFADGVGMTGSFLIKYGVSFGDLHSVQLGMRQMHNMFLFGMDEKNGLPYHGFQCGSKVKYGIVGWGRAVGWLIMGLARSMDCLKRYLTSEGEKKKRDGILFDVCQSGYEECSRAYRQLFRAVKPYQKGNGAFAWQLGAMEGPEDSSATAMIAYAVLMWMRQEGGDSDNNSSNNSNNGNDNSNNKISSNSCEGLDKRTSDWEDAKDLVDRAAKYLEGCEKDGKIYRCLAECMGFAEYPQVYGAYPWSLGPGLGVLRKKGV